MDLSERLTQAASAVGILASALPDAVSRGTHYFTDEPTDSQLQQWAARLRDVAPHFFPPATPLAPGTEGVPTGMVPEVWRGMSPATNLAWARTHQPTKPVERRPTYRQATADERRQWRDLTPQQRLAAFRAGCVQDQG